VGQKVNPISLRLGVNRTWDSIWFDEKSFAEKINEDILIRHYIKNRFSRSSLSKIQIDRKPSKTTITIHTARPGLVIGKGGSEVDLLKKELKKKILEKYLKIMILLLMDLIILKLSFYLINIP